VNQSAALLFENRLMLFARADQSSSPTPKILAGAASSSGKRFAIDDVFVN
jgi:hypothetical protein